MDFIQIGDQIIAIDKITCALLHKNGDGIDLYERAQDEGPSWVFRDEEAVAVKKWLANRTKVLVAPAQPSDSGSTK